MPNKTIVASLTLSTAFFLACNMTIAQDNEKVLKGSYAETVLNNFKECDKATPYNTRCADDLLKIYNNCIKENLPAATRKSMNQVNGMAFSDMAMACNSYLAAMHYFTKKYSSPEVGKNALNKYRKVVEEAKAALKQHDTLIKKNMATLDDYLEYQKRPKNYFAVSGTGFATLYGAGYGDTKENAIKEAIKSCQSVSQKYGGFYCRQPIIIPTNKGMCIAVISLNAQHSQQVIGNIEKEHISGYVQSMFCREEYRCPWSGVTNSPVYLCQ